MRSGIAHTRAGSWTDMLRFGALGGALAIAAMMMVAAARADDEYEPLSPAQALELMRQGNNRFSNGTPAHPNTGTERLVDAARSTRPFAVVLSCADPRVPVERVFDRGFGDLYVVRNTGGLAERSAVAGIENGCAQMGAPLLVVLGHNRCAVITAACTNAEILGITPQMVDAVRPAVDAAQAKHPKVLGVTLAPYVAEELVWVNIRTILSRSAELQRLVKAGKVKVVGAVCEVETGEVRFLGEHAETNAIIAAGVQAWPDAAQPVAVTRVETREPNPEPAKPLPVVSSSTSSPITTPAGASIQATRPDAINPTTLMPESITSITTPASTVPPAVDTPSVKGAASVSEVKPPPVRFNPQANPPIPAPNMPSPAQMPKTDAPSSQGEPSKSTPSVAGTRRTVAAETPAVEVPVPPPSRMIPWAYLCAALLAFMVTAGCAMRLAHVSDAQGRMRRSMTLGAKLAIAFGSTAGIIFVLAAVAARSMVPAAAVGLEPDSGVPGGVSMNQMALAGATAVAVLASVIAGVVLIRGLRPLRDLRGALVALADGDMGRNPINSAARDEVGEAARCADKLAASVRDVLGEVTVSSAEVADAATRLNLSARQTAADSADLARHSIEADRLASESRERAEKCVLQLLGAELSSSTHGSVIVDLGPAVESVANIQRASDRLSGTLESLDDLADRAELLALNAGIQAAKRRQRVSAGLDPVSNEARMVGGCAAAVMGTSRGLVNDMRGTLGGAAAALEAAQRAPVIGPQPAPIGEAARAIKDVAETSGRLADMIRTIALTTEKTGASATLAATSAGELMSHTDQLTAIVGRFKRTREVAVDLSGSEATAAGAQDGYGEYTQP